jgi:hypothetical protein
MTTTFQKRQKEMKRLDKQKEKAARRAQRKIERAEKGIPAGGGPPIADANDSDSQDSQDLDPQRGAA